MFRQHQRDKRAQNAVFVNCCYLVNHCISPGNRSLPKLNVLAQMLPYSVSSFGRLVNQLAIIQDQRRANQLLGSCHQHGEKGVLTSHLFYLDTVEQRIREIGIAHIREELRLSPSCSEEEIKRFVIDFVENTIGGYSLYLVNGRFRIGSLATREEVATRPFAHSPYLVDETTAVVRFILPTGTGQEAPVQMSLFEPAQIATDTVERAEQMRWLFLNFFAEAVTHVVRKEDEIWLLETGMRSALYRWVRQEE